MYNQSTSILSQTQSRSQLLPSGIDEFKKPLAGAGVKLTASSEQYHILTREQALVVRDLSKYFESSGTDSIARFVSVLKYLCKKEKYVKKFLVPTLFRRPDETESNIYQDSLFG